MELRVLRYFLAVAREENITKAAAMLHLTQPTLSRQLMQLEEELGVQLFYRSRYHIVLTDEGMLLRRRAQELVDMGLDIPEITRVFLKLKELGLPVEPVYTNEQAVAQLTALRGGVIHA